MANKVFVTNHLTGGNAGALDVIKVTTDGITDDDIAISINNGVVFYKFVTGNEAAVESEPDVIVPDEYSTGVAYDGFGYWGRIEVFIPEPVG